MKNPCTLIQPTLHQFISLRKREKNNFNDKFDMCNLNIHASTSGGDYDYPKEIHSSSKSCSPLKRDFQLLGILSKDSTTSSAMDLNLNYDSQLMSIDQPRSDRSNDLDLFHQPISETVIDPSKSVAKSNSQSKPSSLSSISDLMSIDPSLDISPSTVDALCFDNRNRSDSAIRSAEEVEARIRFTKINNYEDLSAVARCIDFSPNNLLPQPITLISSPYKRKGKKNIKPESIGPSKLNDTNHLMMLQSSKRFVVDFDTNVSCLGQHIVDVIYHKVYDSNIVIIPYLFKD
ncbi:hypothetical protein ZOSMA_71G00270 [Zostera marina]|uniref:Uncharacterized protein n=1 Tax=Zostera marina TaxID=29655 RepID=A0A0K9NSI4_ZOSMR|nr:hypothetical protein ZOSMA_71G00270 [Zostera marina]